MNCQADTPITESSTLRSQSVKEIKSKKGRPPNPKLKDEKGRYLCSIKWHKDDYQENLDKNIQRSNKHQIKYRESFRILKELVEHHDITLPSTIKEKIDKLLCC